MVWIVLVKGGSWLNMSKPDFYIPRFLNDIVVCGFVNYTASVANYTLMYK